MLALDVNSEDSVSACVTEVLERAGRLDVLVNNAGYALSGAAEETTDAEAKDQFETNFFGVVRVTKAALPAMREAGFGRLITIGSVAGLLAIPYQAFYCATKYALEGYLEALWYELQPFGIAVSLIEPGFVRTPISQASRSATHRLDAYNGPRDRAITAVERGVEKGIAPDQVAEVVLHAAQSKSPRLRYRVGGDSKWLPRLRTVTPWGVFASGVKRTFDIEAEGESRRAAPLKPAHPQDERNS